MFKNTLSSATQSKMKEKHIKLPIPKLPSPKIGGGGAAKPAGSGGPPAAARPSTLPETLGGGKPAGAKPPAPKKAGGGSSPIKFLLPLVAILAIAALGYFGYTRFFAGGGGEQTTAENPAPQDGFPADSAVPLSAENAAPLPDDPPDSGKSLRVQRTTQPVAQCAGKPKFLGKVGLAGDVTFSTDEPGIRGLILFGASAENSDAVSRYQHQSWSSAGFLDAFVTDRNGNVYFAPSPRTGLGVSQPRNQDQIFKLNTTNGVLASYITLPSAAPPSPENQFGVLGLAFDCTSNSLFATTVTGSTGANQVGRIFRIDVGTGEIIGQLDNVDAYGIGIRPMANGSQLVFGSPRDTQIRALDVDAQGKPQGEPRVVATLNDPLRARKITFSNTNEMVVEAAEFNFANADLPQENEVRFTFDAAADSWKAQ